MTSPKRPRSDSDEDMPHTKKSRAEVTCQVCGKDFQDVKRLNDHIVIHAGCIVCDLCGKSFTSTYSLKRHQKQKHYYSEDITVHARLHCSVCGKTFSNKYNRLRHEQTVHEINDRPYRTTYKCHYCDQRFDDKVDLVTHVRTAHTLQNQSGKTCSLCNQCFSSSSNKRRHDLRVHNIRPYPCPHCDSTFTQYRDLFQHVNANHPLNQTGGRMQTRDRTLHDRNVTNTTTDTSGGVKNDNNTTANKADVVESERSDPIHDNVDESALQNGVQNRSIFPRDSDRYDLLVFFADVREEIVKYLASRVTGGDSIKWNLVVNVEMRRDSAENGEDVTHPYFRSNTFITLNLETFSEDEVSLALQQMYANMEKFVREGSQWYLGKVIKLDINTVIYRPITGSTYLPLPKQLAFNKSCLNIENVDSKCFLYSILASLHPSEHTPTKVNQYKRYANEVNMNGISYPVSLDQLDKVEGQNPNISISAFGWEDKLVIPLKLTKQQGRLHHINLLLIKQGDISHWCLIKKFDRFMMKTKGYHGTYHFCHYCLHGFKKASSLANHVPYCSSHGPQRIELPTEKDKMLSFSDLSKTQRCPVVIYCDLETINTKVLGPEPNPESSNTTPISKMEVCGFGYKLVCLNPKYTKPTVIYRGDNACEKLIESLLAEQNRMAQILKDPAPLLMTPQDEAKAKTETVCCICNNTFSNYDRVYGRLVRHHCHVMGTYIGMAHNVCNVNSKQSDKVKVFFHNLKGFDGHFIALASAKFKDWKLTCLAQTAEKYISFTLGKLVFVDSLAFLTSSLEVLVNSLYESGVDKFHHMNQEFPDQDQRNLLLKKQIYMYDYMDHTDRFSETSLPDKEAFYNRLKKEHISDSDYEHAQTVYTTFQLRNLGSYHDLYLKCDVILLSDVFESFRNTCMTHYGLDPAQFYSSPGFSWSACLRMTRVSLQLMTDIDHILFMERGLRGGVSQISNRHKKANNPLLKEFDPNQETSYIMYFDANNLYGWAMSQALPVSGFTFLSKREIDQLDIQSIPQNGDDGYMLEVDMHYPESLHDLHNDLPLAPEKCVVTDEMLSPYCRSLMKQLHARKRKQSGKTTERDSNTPPNRARVEKLITSLRDKESYVLHYRHLQLCLQLGLRITKIHRVLKFKQRAWMEPYIAFNTTMRQKATTPFEKSLYKLLNNSVFGKTMENVRKHKCVELVHTKKRLKKVSAKCNYKASTIFSEDLVAVELYKTYVKLYKPLFSGVSTLEISKTLVYSFFYNYLKPKYGDNLSLLMTDTDSVMIHVKTENVYLDMKDRLDLFDTSDYPKDHELYSSVNQKVVGKMKDELKSIPISVFTGLRSKLYAFKSGEEEQKKAKGISKYTIAKDIRLRDYTRVLFGEKPIYSNMALIRSHKHDMYGESVNKCGLSPFDDKRFHVSPTSSYAYGHYKILEEFT